MAGGGIIRQMLRKSQSPDPSSFRRLALFGAGISGFFSFSTLAYADHDQAEAEAEHRYPWPNHGILSSYDNASNGGGDHIYRQACASCHSGLSLTSYTDKGEKESKAMPAEIEVVDNPNSKADIFTCPGLQAAAQFAPSNLSLITKDRQNYVFSLLTAYRNPLAAAVSIQEGLHYNPCLSGGAILMPKMLHDKAFNVKMVSLP